MKIYTNIHNKIGYRFAKKNIIRKDAWRLSVVYVAFRVTICLQGLFLVKIPFRKS